MTNPYANRTPTEIASSVTVQAAAAAVAIRPHDVPRLCCDAFHEAAHVVTDACLGYKTGYVYIPIRDCTGSPVVPGYSHWQWPGIKTLPGWQRPGQPHATTFQALYQRDDLTTSLEEATGFYAGMIAELVLSGDKPPIIPANAAGDFHKAQYYLSDYLGAVVGRQSKRVHARGFGLLHKCTFGTAKTLVARHYTTIDAVAAVILCHGNNGGIWWTKAHQTWLDARLTTVNAARDSAARKVLIPRPRWLASTVKSEPADFELLRQNVKKRAAAA